MPAIEEISNTSPDRCSIMIGTACRVNRKLVKGVARVPAEHAQELGTHVEVVT